MIAKTHETSQDPPFTDTEAERWWWDEVGVLVEHEVWHLPQIAEQQGQR
jgi:hypothetical protein